MRFALTLFTLIALAATANAQCVNGVCSMLTPKAKTSPVVHRQTAEPPVATAAYHAAPAKTGRLKLFRRR